MPEPCLRGTSLSVGGSLVLGLLKHCLPELRRVGPRHSGHGAIEGLGSTRRFIIRLLGFFEFPKP